MIVGEGQGPEVLLSPPPPPNPRQGPCQASRQPDRHGQNRIILGALRRGEGISEKGLSPLPKNLICQRMILLT
jgi:hypothetical protein